MTAFYLRHKHMGWILLFGVWVLHGAVAFWQFVSITSGIQNFPFGLSSQQLLVSGALLIWVILNLVLFFRGIAKPDVRARWSAFLEGKRVHDGILVTAALLAFFFISLLFYKGLFGEQLMEQYGGYITLLTPAIHLAIYVSLETIMVMLVRRFLDQTVVDEIFSGFAWKALAILVVFGLGAVVISSTGLGITRVYGGDWGFGRPSVPLLEWQILLACLLSVGMVIVETGGRVKFTFRADFWIALLIWLGATMIWLSHPVVTYASAMVPRQPNFEIYPFLDARVYDFYSQSVLVGNGFGAEQIPQRSLYIAFLTLLHVLVGQDYNSVIAAQTLIWAFFPVLLYFLGKEFFGRPVGIAIALLAILRDYTSNLVAPFTGNLSYSKLYLSEIPTAMLLALFVLLGMRWIKAGFPGLTGWWLGGILGVGMLIRTQGVVALPVIVLFGFLAQPKKIGLLARGMVIILLSTALTIAPWLWRNWLMTGELIFDNPVQSTNLAMRYSRINYAKPDTAIQPGESVIEYQNRLWRIASDAISANPTEALRGVASYFLNHGVNNVLLFPLRNELNDFGELATPTTSFWQKWTGEPTPPQAWLIVFYTSLLGLGVAVAWHRNGWLGLLPLGLNLAYNLWTSLALLSGQRFMLTMDWSISLYYMIGLFALLSSFMYALKGGRAMICRWYEANPVAKIQPVLQRHWWNYALVGLLFLGIGISLPLSEKVFPQRYPLFAQDEILNEILSARGVEQSGLDAVCLQDILNDSSTKIVQGRALYPGFYDAGEGEIFTDAVGYKPVNEGRLVFEMVGQEDARVIIPMTQSPDFFPNASDVILVLGEDGQVKFVVVEQGGLKKFYVSSRFVPPVCE